MSEYIIKAPSALFGMAIAEYAVKIASELFRSWETPGFRP
jgi:hypothetical protein